MYSLLTRPICYLAFAISSFVCCFPLRAQVGNIAPLYGIAGIQTFNKLSSINGSIVKLLPLAAVVYYGNNRLNQNKLTILKYLDSNMMDTTYGGSASGASLAAIFVDALFHSDGKLVIAANARYTDFYLADVHNDIIISRYKTNGTPDAGFGGARIVTSNILEDLQILPLHLVDFTGAPVNGISKLKWQTADKVNVCHFTIERRDPNSNHFLTIIDNIPAGGQLNSSYTVFDKQPLPGDNYHLLKMADCDWLVSGSKLVRVRFEEKLQMTVYPNRATDFIYVKSSSGLAGEVQVTIYDAWGEGCYLRQFLLVMIG